MSEQGTRLPPSRLGYRNLGAGDSRNPWRLGSPEARTVTVSPDAGFSPFDLNHETSLMGLSRQTIDEDQPAAYRPATPDRYFGRKMLGIWRRIRPNQADQPSRETLGTIELLTLCLRFISDDDQGVGISDGPHIIAPAHDAIWQIAPMILVWMIRRHGWARRHALDHKGERVCAVRIWIGLRAAVR
ncbi:hypothetical protein FA13DRAFT_1713367 [Coprinellus micaceus]|uniref:Uncharacterized protein n=1 Tax=Coprinellus micaceus TaxID=71717 RepID=A0A4Y7SXK9_COPMI|nr:hypothetical protein FA13DRAFT_1713367 [Coprinellus micaceus]